MEHGALPAERPGDDGVLGRGRAAARRSPAGEAERRPRAGDVDGILEADGEAVQGAHGPPVGGEVGVEPAGVGEGGGEEDLCQARGELVGQRGAVAEGLCDAQGGPLARGGPLEDPRGGRLGYLDLGRGEELVDKGAC